MNTHIDYKLLKENPISESIVEFLKFNEKEISLEDSDLYYNFPLYSEENVLQKSEILIVSRKYGIFLFKGLDYSERTLTQDLLNLEVEKFGQTYSFLFSKLIKGKNLRLNPTKLKINIIPLIFLNVENISLETSWENLRLFNDLKDLKKMILENRLDDELDFEIYKELISIIEGSSALIKSSERKLTNPKEDSKGRILEKIENEVANFDKVQKRSALTIIDGPQRIRGLAGSGKTIILTMKAAQIHLLQPDSIIVYTYSTKCLYDFIKRLITRFYREFSDKDPDWSKIHIMHTWGGESLDGTYHNICKENGIVPETFKQTNFKQACENVLKSGIKLKKIYDYLILDEGQDCPASFYKICRESTKNNRMIWAYDECQNVFNMEIQDTIKTFGNDETGKPHIDFSRDLEEGQDFVLDRCYRNPREILASAFALGLGIYGQKIIQMPENPAYWTDLGFRIERGEYKTGSDIEIIVPKENSPKLKRILLEDKSPIKWKIFDDFENECNYIVSEIVKDLEEDLLPQDISVISLDDQAAKSYFRNISKKLSERGIETFNLQEGIWDNQNYSMKNCITLSSVYKAKGNESGSVYVVGVDSIFSNLDINPIVERNKLFCAITRAKAWVTLTGTGDSTKLFDNEMKKILENNFKLIFNMPDLAELRIFKRDLAKKQVMLNEVKKELDKIAEKNGYDRESFYKTCGFNF